MQIKLLRYVGERERVNKSGMFTNEFVLDGHFVNDSSVINPTILIEKETAPTETYYNYMYINRFKRYYFVNEIITRVNGIWEIKGHVDVLYTYSSNILQNKVILDKCEESDKANLYLNDGSFVMDSHKYNQVKKFPNGLSSSGHNILICAGG